MLIYELLRGHRRVVQRGIHKVSTTAQYRTADDWYSRTHIVLDTVADVSGIVCSYIYIGGTTSDTGEIRDRKRDWTDNRVAVICSACSC